MPRSIKSNPCKEFQTNLDFLNRFSICPPEEADIVTVWNMGSWCFSPMCQWPATWPLLYITAPFGGGKTVLGQDVCGCLGRDWRSATGATGSTLFRMLGREDEETGEIENLAPMLCVDEIDTTFAGSKDPDLQRAINVKYKRGATIPRSAGKSYIDFPVYGPLVMMGMDNGHLPDSVIQRAIRIELEKKSQQEKEDAGVEDFLIFDVEDEAAEIQQMNSDWAKKHSMVFRDYRPKAPKGLTARQWEIGRSIVQLAHAMGPGMEARITKSLVTVFNRKRGQEDAKQRLYVAINELFESTGAPKIRSRDILAHLREKGIGVSGNSTTGLGHLLARDGIQPKSVWIVDEDHPDGKSHRGYQRYQFDQAFVDFLPHDDDDE